MPSDTDTLKEVASPVPAGIIGRNVPLINQVGAVTGSEYNELHVCEGRRGGTQVAGSERMCSVVTQGMSLWGRESNRRKEGIANFKGLQLKNYTLLQRMSIHRV